jgi:hypothetical protein
VAITVTNPGGRPRDLIGFREPCRERTLEIVEVMECVFFKGHWPKRTKQVSDAVRIQAGVLLVANGWGTPPNSTELKITVPGPPPRSITREMTQAEAAEAYAQTVRQGYFDDSGAVPQLEPPGEPATIEGDFDVVDVTPDTDGDA